METKDTHLDINTRVAKAKASFVTRRVNLGLTQALITNQKPKPGDLVLAKVVRIKRQTRLELCNGRRAHLYEGDELILAYGNRYATDQFEAEVPSTLAPCQLVAAGGLAAKVIAKHDKLKGATEIEPLGLLANIDGNVMNLSHYALPSIKNMRSRPLTVAVFGTSMNSGKTTMASDLVHGASRQGMKVNAAKITGTGSGPDIWKMLDAGANEMLDFTDQGYASTVDLSLHQLLDITRTLISRLSTRDTDLVVLEIADGLLQTETSLLVNSPEFRSLVDGCLIASSDAIAAVGAVHHIQSLPMNVLAIGGMMTLSPMTSKEATDACGIPFLTRSDIHNKEVVQTLLAELESTAKDDVTTNENIVAFGRS